MRVMALSLFFLVWAGHAQQVYTEHKQRTQANWKLDASDPLKTLAMFLVGLGDQSAAWQTTGYRPDSRPSLQVPARRVAVSMNGEDVHQPVKRHAQMDRRSVLGTALGAAAAASLVPRPAEAVYDASKKREISKFEWNKRKWLISGSDGSGRCFEKTYTDPKHPEGLVRIRLKAETFGDEPDIYRLALVEGGGGKGEPDYWKAPAEVLRDLSITIDLTKAEPPLPKAKKITGYYVFNEDLTTINTVEYGLLFPKDDMFWPQEDLLPEADRLWNPTRAYYKANEEYLKKLKEGKVDKPADIVDAVQSAIKKGETPLSGYRNPDQEN